MHHKITFSSRLHFLLAICFLACIFMLGSAVSHNGEVKADGGGQTDTLVTGPAPAEPNTEPIELELNTAVDDSPALSSAIGVTIIWVCSLLP